MSRIAKSRTLWVGLLCLLGLGRGATAGTNEWTPAGTGLSSVVNTVEFHASRPGTLYAGAADGFYRSADGGKTWQIHGVQLVDRTVLSLAVDEKEADRVYAGLNSGLFVSADGGNTWEKGAGLSAGVLGIETADSLIYAGTFGWGVFISRDQGRTWSAGGDSLASDIVFALGAAPQGEGTVYAGTARGLFVSQDAGDSWSPLGDKLQGQSVRSIYLGPEDAGLIFVATFGAGIWRSLDGGQTWAPLNNGLEDLKVRSLAVDGEFDQVMCAGTSTSGFFRTTDGGAGWVAINESLPFLAARRVVLLPEEPRRVLGMGQTGGVWEIRFAPQPQIRVGRDPLIFGNVPVGVVQGRHLVLENPGDADLEVSRLSVDPGSGFSVAASTFFLASGDTGSVEVRFQPQSRGPASSTLIIRSNDPDEPQISIALQGAGVEAELTALPTAIQFGEVRVGGFKDTTVVLTNSGNAALSLRNAFFEDSAFRLLNFQAQVLPPGRSAVLRVRFVPLLPRGISSKLVVIQDAQLPPLEVFVDGIGTAPDIAVSPAALDFGQVNPGEPKVLVLEISNSGNTDLTVHELVLTGDPFRADLTPPLVIPPGQAEHVDLTFLPLVSGAHEGVLQIVSDVPGRMGTLEIPLAGTGGALALRPQPAVAAGGGPVDLLIEDWNLDDLPDLAVADSANGQVRVMRNDGTGSFDELAVYPGPSSVYRSFDEPVALAAAPIFGSAPDLIVADRVARSISILENDGEGRFDHSREDIFIGHGITDVLAEDLDADGDVDIAVANGDDPSITLLFNNGQGSFNARTTRTVEVGPVALAAGNLNTDGHADLVVANGWSGTVSVLFSDRSGGFRSRQDIVVGEELAALAVVDYDADGDNDILVASRGSRDVAILENELQTDGESNLVLTRRLHLGVPVVDLALSDLTADVFSDLVVASPEGSHVAYLENEAGQDFTARSILESSGPARKVEIADMNDDGANDILVLNTAGGTLQVFLNENTRRLDPPRPPTGVRAKDAAGDLGRQIEILWEAPELDEQIGRTTEYVVFRAPIRTGPFTAIDTVAAGKRSAVDVTATLADTFYYYVRAGSAVLESLPSDTVWAVSRTAPFFELQVLNEARFSVGDTLKVRAFVTPAEHQLAGLSLFLTFEDSVLTLLPAGSSQSGVQPFRVDSTLGSLAVLENRLHPHTTNKANLSLAQLNIEPGVEPVHLGEIWFRTSRDTVTSLSIDDEPLLNRRSAVVEDGTGEWILPFIPARPTLVSIRDYQVTGQVQLQGRSSPNLDVQVSLFFVHGGGDTLRSPLNDEDRLRPGIQHTLDEDGRFYLVQVPRSNYRILVKTPTHLQGRVQADTAFIGESLRTSLSFRWVASDSSASGSLPAGDANDDNRINLADFGVFVRHFGTSAAELDDWPRARAADFDGDDQVNSGDFFLLADHFGEVGMELGAALAKPVTPQGWVRPAPRGIQVGDLGPVAGFSLLVLDADEVEFGVEGTIWAGREVKILQWQEGGAVRLAGALEDPERPVSGEGTLLYLGAGANGRTPQVVEVEVLRADGEVQRHLLQPVRTLPQASVLLQSYPNPFNPTTTIPFVVGATPENSAHVRLEIYNGLGQKVRTLVDGELSAGMHQIQWNGRDDRGDEVASGLYLYRVRVGDFLATRRLLLVR